MPKVVVVLADGFEEVEAMAIVDILRRGEIETVIAGLHGGPVVSARKVKVLPDTTIDTIRAEDYDMIVLPGGQPGSDNLNADERVKQLIRDFHDKGKYTGAICAAPYVLANAGVLKGRCATAYPSYRDRLGGAVYQEKSVVEDSTVLTSRGAGTALCFGLAIVGKLVSREKATAIKEAMLIREECD
ncbi:MAG: DJ-1/PfpI family protein [Alphaproteobacteria bacterium]|uniref:DJ-1/PfpI family protein n=1 Tax=Candidatus Nitrobium versatile TaxID=2884831 RepID=A0A953J9U8_9BACT|nr:DJ-1/PfpI family protein [Candidatus Nitrobium versatile]